MRCCTPTMKYYTDHSGGIITLRNTIFVNDELCRITTTTEVHGKIRNVKEATFKVLCYLESAPMFSLTTDRFIGSTLQYDIIFG